MSFYSSRLTVCRLGTKKTGGSRLQVRRATYKLAFRLADSLR